MHFHGTEDLPKESLDAITNAAIEHCITKHCTCDPCIRFVVAGLVLTGFEVQELGTVEVIHAKDCYASGRNN